MLLGLSEFHLSNIFTYFNGQCRLFTSFLINQIIAYNASDRLLIAGTMGGGGGGGGG